MKNRSTYLVDQSLDDAGNQDLAGGVCRNRRGGMTGLRLRLGRIVVGMGAAVHDGVARKGRGEAGIVRVMAEARGAADGSGMVVVVMMVLMRVLLLLLLVLMIRLLLVPLALLR